MDIYSEETLMQFAEQNPLDFSEHRIEFVRRDFYRQKRKTVSDEFVDYVLWAEGNPSRQEHFGIFLLPVIKARNWKSILEVGCGETALLSKWLYSHLEGKVKMTAIDKCNIHCDEPEITLIQREFSDNEKLTDYDAVIAQEPCEASELIIKNCTEQKIPFCVILCGVPHTRLTGELDKDAYSWYAYLLKTYPDCKFMIWKNGRFSSGCIYSEEFETYS